MMLSAHFTLEEMVLSQEAVRLGIDNAPGEREIDALEVLCSKVLEPLRAAIGRPLVVSSGYRCPALNAAVGGAANSDHLRGQAADVTAHPMTVNALAAAAREVALAAPIHQVIVEFGAWVHVSVRSGFSLDGDDAPEFLVATRGADGRTIYSKWEV